MGDPGHGLRPPTTARRRPALVAACIVGFVVVAGALSWLYDGQVAGAVVYEGVGYACAGLLAWIAARRGRPQWPWWCLAFGLAASATGDLFWDVAALVSHAPEATSVVANGWYLVAYPAYIAGIIGLLGRRDRNREATTLLEGAVAAISVWLVVWAFFVWPQTQTVGVSITSWLGSLAFPPLDIVIVIAVWGLGRSVGRRSATWWLFMGWVGLTLVADVVYAMQVFPEGSFGATVLNVSWLITYGLLAGAAWTWGESDEDTAARDDESSVERMRPAVRIAALGTALVIPSALLLFHPAAVLVEPRILGVAGIALVVAAGMRLWMAWSGQRSAEDALAWNATHDPLTGLANRFALMEILEGAIKRASRSGRPCAVLFVDLDEFKVVNDSLGHAVGDELLIAVSRRIVSAVRDVDAVARLGGDEFVVVCENLTSNDEAELVADRVLEALGDDIVVSQRKVHVGASIGLVLNAEQFGTSAVLLRNADLAMYEAKEQGRDRVAHYDESLPVRMAGRLETETALRGAIAQGELYLDYQPIVSLGDGTTVAFEALVRWDRPGYGVVGPDTFVPIAEESGLISDLGSWVLRRALHQWRCWNDVGGVRVGSDGMRPQIAINVSPRQLRVREAAQQILAIIETEGVSPGDVLLEVTETALLEPTEVVETNLAALRDAGVSFAIDDFGTGYSSLAALRRMAVRCIKIDKSFVSRLGCDPDGVVFVRTIITLAHELDMTCTAEGVERPEQLALLTELGCDHVQGFLIGRPGSFALETGEVVQPGGQGGDRVVHQSS